MEFDTMFEQARDYAVDSFQRHVLFWDIMRKRGNVYLDHVKAGQPPVLKFEYEIIMNGKDLERPVNYNLARILPPEDVVIDDDKRPVIIVDPRAGHGPGIGGSKRESEIGMALNGGHPVYFILFETDPVPGQTIPDVEKAEIQFIDEVTRRHPRSRRPSVTGNCQAGWAMAMLSADRPGTTGPIVLNGSPLSYWAGIEGKDTMRYLGGLLGGIWLTSLLCDLGGGKFDGAYLVQNFENMNPANTLWTKQYNVWAGVDTEEKRYLNFERWWNGFFNMTEEEICFIVENLFVGNKLEQGSVELDEKRLDFRDIEDPMLVFASQGDAITPPAQALNWILKIWESEEEIKNQGQVIIYMLHPSIGHLGIFVSGKVAAKEHKEIIGSYDLIEYLPPGLYEMVIDDSDKGMIPGANYWVLFEERTFDDLMKLDDGMEDEEDFSVVAAVSEKNDAIYRTLVRPWIRPLISETTAEVLRQLNPLRFAKYSISDLNPFIVPFKIWAPDVRKHRKAITADNFFMSAEKSISKMIVANLNACANMQAAASEYMFKSIYGNPWLKWLMLPADAGKAGDDRQMTRKRSDDRDRQYWIGRMGKGGFLEGLIRVLAAIGKADRSFDRDEFLKIQKIVREHDRLKTIPVTEFRRIAREQTRLLQIDEDVAIETLARLLRTEKDRKDVQAIVEKTFEDNVMAEETRTLIRKLKKADMEHPVS